MGYYNAQGKYVGDDGKTYANYNDALAQSNSLRGRRSAERALSQTERDIQDTRMTQNVQGVLKNSLGSLFGTRGLYDPGLATLDKRLAGQESQKRVLTQTINDYRQGMGESPLTGEVADSSGRNDQGADLDMATIKRLAAEFDKSEPSTDLRNPILSDDASARDSALVSMRDQYAPGADIWSTAEGKAILEAARTNTYGGKEQGTLAEFNTQQRQAGIGANDEIIEALGYEGNMAEWAKANPALAMREYNKKFGNSYEGTGSGDANSVLANGMTAGEDARQAAMNAAAIMEGTGRPRESNTERMAPAQPAAIQAQNNNDLNLAGVGQYAEGVEGLEGKELLERYAAALRGGN